MKLHWLKPEEIKGNWPEIAPQFHRVVQKAVHGEYGVDDLYRMAQQGAITVGIARAGDEVVMALAFEFKHYPKALGVNVLAMGGKRMGEFMERFLPPFKRFCRQAGADFIECSVSPAMERLHHKIGFKTVYRNLRMNLQEEKNAYSKQV